MHPYKKKFALKIENNNNFRQNLKQYFLFYNFDYSEKEENTILFFKKFSYLSGWRFNPLNWESEIKITILNNTLEIAYINKGNSQITPFAFDGLYNSFFNNLNLFVNKSIDFKEKNKQEIKKAKQKVFLQFLIIIACIFVFVIIGWLLKKEFNLHFLSKFSVVIGALLSLKMLNKYWIHKVV